MSTNATPDLEKQVEEAVKEKEKEMMKQFDDIMYIKTARIIKAMKERFGEEAYDVIVALNSERVKEAWRKKAEEHGDNSIESIIQVLWEQLPPEFEWTMEKTQAGVQMKCTRCPVADAVLPLGVGEEIYYDHCKNDWALVEGFNPNMGFTMTKSLMRGDDCCNHFYYYKNKTKT